MDSRLRIGVMGCSSFARRAMLPALLAHPDAELVAVASRSRDKAADLAAEFKCRAVSDYSALVADADVDAIYMPLPTGIHEPWALASIAAGKHLLIEKSLAPDAQAAERIVTAGRTRGCLIWENFLFVHHSQFSWVQERIQGGDLGRVLLIRCTFGFPPLPVDNFRYDAGLGGGALLDPGAYCVRMALALKGDCWAVRGASRIEDGTKGVDIHGSFQLEHSDGTSFQAAYSFNSVYQCSIEIIGTAGRLYADRIFTPPPGFSPRVRIEQQGQWTEYQLQPADHYFSKWTAFAACVRGQDYVASWNELAAQARLLDAVRLEGRQHPSAKRGLLDN